MRGYAPAFGRGYFVDALFAQSLPFLSKDPDLGPGTGHVRVHTDPLRTVWPSGRGTNELGVGG